MTAVEHWNFVRVKTVSPVTHERVTVDTVLNETVFFSALQFELNLAAVCNFSHFVD